MSDGAPDTRSPRPAGHSGLWPVLVLITLGLIPFVVSLAVVVYVRREAANDPNAQQWIDEHAGRSKLIGSGAKK